MTLGRLEISTAGPPRVNRPAGSSTSNVALADRWNGTAWVIQRTAQPPKGWTPVFGGVSCTSARACTAVGDRYRQDGSG